MEKKSFVKGAAVLAVAGLIVKIIGAVYRIPLTNIVGANGMSYYEVAYPYYSALLVVSSAGLPTAISKMVSERVTLGDFRGAKEVFATALKLLIGIGVISGTLMFVGADMLVSSTPLPEAAMSLRALAPALLFVSIMCAYRGYLQGMQMMAGTAVSQVAEQIFKLAVGFTLAYYFLPRGPEYAAMGALIGVSVSELIALIVIIIFYAKNRSVLDIAAQTAPKRRPQGFKRVTFKLLSIAIPVTVGASIMPITGIVDAAMIMDILMDIGFTLDQAKAAFTALRSYVTPLINMPAVLTMALAMSLVPAISSFMAAKDYKGVRRAARTGTKLALIIGAPCAAGLYVLAQPILKLLFSSLQGSHLALAADIMRTAAIGVIFLSLVQTLTGVIQGMGKPNVPVVNLIFGGVIKVVSMLILTRMPDINIQGAAVSTVACYAAAGLLDLIYMIKKTRMKVNVWDMFVKPLFSALVMGVIVYITYNALLGVAHEMVATLASVVAGVAVYAALAVLLRMLNANDLAFIPGGRKLSRILYRERK